MKIVTWNCNGALRKKTANIDSLGADILVIQECEDPTKSTKKYRQWADDNYLWQGETKNKGLGVFARNGHKIELLKWFGEFSIKGINNNSKSLSWSSNDLQSFMPLMIDEKYILVAIWTKKANSPNFGYIGQFWKYIQIHKEKLKRDNIILCGDLNSNAIWDEPDRWWNHSDVVKELEEINIISLYHHVTGETQGKEKQKTFYMYRKRNKPYHIDYVFMSKALLGTSSLQVHGFNNWIELSDHVPLLFSVDE
jgi:exodeoxyribonuclease-3